MTYAGGFTYYVAIINFDQLTEGGDPIDLATAVIPVNGVDEGNLTVSGPTTVTDDSPYSVIVDYDEPGMTAIDKLYGYFTVGSDPGNPGSVATVRVGLQYLGIPDIDISPLAQAATVVQDATQTQTLTLSTSGGVLEWDLMTSGSGLAEALCNGVDSIDWLDASPSSGTLYPGQTELVMTFNAAGLESGVHTDSLCIVSNDPDEPPLAVPVTMTVLLPDHMFNDGFE